ncbi:MAG: hypothetical protein GEV08_00560 [Acidimicrobiia bacterium]|nr:hypothetical protein [Acidimicrobiia bacterium]
MAGKLKRLRALLAGALRPETSDVAGGGGPGRRVSGDPPSGNGASSFHLFWALPGEFVAARATIEVLAPPTVSRLYFWALQGSFVDHGRRGGAAHLGLQWHPQYPGATAVNWGGYQEGGPELFGTASTLPGALGNPHTRDYPWRPGWAYQLSIEAAPPAAQPGDGRTAWRGSVTDLASGERTVVRDLMARGSRLSSLMVWSEVFARCEHPSVEVRWSGFEALTEEGTVERPPSVQVNYQDHAGGGCANTDSAAEDGCVLQRTNHPRRHHQGSRLDLR